ncbi:MAG TPA: M20/M25/M40 family metallo-hydrolase [Gemmatimonadaceae bacterium]|nr:M20/M25/M40 family metallo-hydrolase [Gemmatimonadaceae bacterium]
MRLLLALAALPAVVVAQSAPAPSRSLRTALDSIRARNAWTLEQQSSICQIPAPPFKEQTRAAELVRRFEALGLRGARIDAEGNVIAERKGTAANGPAVVLSAHLDTVFPEGTDVTVKSDGARMSGPGIGDDCRGLAVLLSVARAVQEAKVATPGTIYFVGTVGEEGQGNLRGVRHLFGTEMKGKIDYFISVDGTGLGITSRAVGSHRYRVSYRGPGGHSYGAFGMPNPIHALGRAIAAIADLEVPEHPRTTFSVGVIRGGTSVNSIPTEGQMDIDMRSESAEALAALDAQVQRVLRDAMERENARWPRSAKKVSLAIDTIGIRPAGAQPDSARIVRVARDAARTLGFDAGATSASSTDANIAIALGVPAITIDGGGEGGGAHSPDEWYADGDRGWLGPQWAAVIAVRLAGGK